MLLNLEDIKIPVRNIKVVLTLKKKKSCTEKQMPQDSIRIFL